MSPTNDRIRSWWTDDPLEPARPTRIHPEVQELLASLAPGEEAVELGGTMSLNLHLTPSDRVVRVHQPFVTAARLQGEQAVRRIVSRPGWLRPHRGHRGQPQAGAHPRPPARNPGRAAARPTLLHDRGDPDQGRNRLGASVPRAGNSASTRCAAVPPIPGTGQSTARGRGHPGVVVTSTSIWVATSAKSVSSRASTRSIEARTLPVCWSRRCCSAPRITCTCCRRVVSACTSACAGSRAGVRRRVSTVPNRARTRASRGSDFAVIPLSEDNGAHLPGRDAGDRQACRVQGGEQRPLIAAAGFAHDPLRLAEVSPDVGHSPARWPGSEGDVPPPGRRHRRSCRDRPQRRSAFSS